MLRLVAIGLILCSCPAALKADDDRVRDSKSWEAMHDVLCQYLVERHSSLAKPRSELVKPSRAFISTVRFTFTDITEAFEKRKAGEISLKRDSFPDFIPSGPYGSLREVDKYCDLLLKILVEAKEYDEEDDRYIAAAEKAWPLLLRVIDAAWGDRVSAGRRIDWYKKRPEMAGMLYCWSGRGKSSMLIEMTKPEAAGRHSRSVLDAFSHEIKEVSLVLVGVRLPVWQFEDSRVIDALSDAPDNDYKMFTTKFLPIIMYSIKCMNADDQDAFGERASCTKNVGRAFSRGEAKLIMSYYEEEILPCVKIESSVLIDTIRILKEGDLSKLPPWKKRGRG